MNKLSKSTEETKKANRERQRKWYNKNKKKNTDVLTVFNDWQHQLYETYSDSNPDFSNLHHMSLLKDIMIGYNINENLADNMITKLSNRNIIMNNDNNKIEGHTHEITQNDFKRELDRRGNRDITGDNFADEPAHNGKDARASKQGFFFKDDKIFFGNNGDFLDWETHLRKGIGYGDIPGTNTTTTSYWGVGATKFTMYRDGIPSHTGHSKQGKYFIRHFGYKKHVNELTKKTIQDLVLADSIPCVFQEYEVSEERYRESVHADEFGFLPTHFVQVRRYNDSNLVYDAGKMVESLNFAFMSLNIEHDEIFVKVGDGKTEFCRPRYYPAVKKTGIDSYSAVKNFRDLDLYQEDVVIGDGTFDVYGYQVLNAESERIKEWDHLRDATRTPGKRSGNDIIKLSGRGQNPMHIYVNHRGVQLIQDDVWQEMLKRAGLTSEHREMCKETVMVFHEKTGKKEWPAIKTSGVDEDTQAMACKIHYENVLETTKSSKSIAFNKRKKEDGKVDTIVSILNTQDKAFTANRDAIINSIVYLSDNNLTMQDIENPKNRSVRENYKDGRNYDLLIAKTDAPTNEYVFHAEFQNGSEDWPHIDQITSKILSGTCYYNVLVTDTLASKKIKRDYFKRIMQENNIQAKVWLCTNEELLKGWRQNFELINDPEQNKVEVAA